MKLKFKNNYQNIIYRKQTKKTVSVYNN